VEDIFTGLRAQATVANGLTTFRALSVLPALPLVYVGWYEMLLVLIVLAAFSDVEGELARKTGTTTALGRLLDPTADKLFVNTLLLVHLFGFGGSVWELVMLVCTLAYDFDTTMRRFRKELIPALRNDQTTDIVSVSWVSKIKTTALFMYVIALYYVIAFPGAIAQHTLDISAFAIILLVLASWWVSRTQKT